ncbi:MAG: hypothetical protein P9M02_04580 [Candidatus Susulua stagnicola]|nr:hypothetical protein [Candidatus Susulua stagnicola]
MNKLKFLLMPKKFSIFFSLVFSALLHLVVVFCCFLQITAKGDPFFCNWSKILSHKDLFFEKKEVAFSKNLDLFSNNIRKKYFSPHYLPRFYPSKGKKDFNSRFFISNITKMSQPLKDFKVQKNYVYLWDKGSVFSSREEEESISYKAYISPYGKVLFLYPERLPNNSYGSLYLQEYIREAAFFLNDRFFWTKLEGIVK